MMFIITYLLNLDRLDAVVIFTYIHTNVVTTKNSISIWRFFDFICARYLCFWRSIIFVIGVACGVEMFLLYAV